MGRQQPATWRDLESDRVKTIVALVSERATTEKVGQALTVTKQRARQLMKKVADAHGQDVFKGPEKFWTIRETAKELKVGRAIIVRLCAKGEVGRRRGVSEKSNYVISQAELEKLRCHPAVTRTRTCDICENDFICHSSCQKLNICPAIPCQKVWRHRRRVALISQPATLSSLVGWQKKLWLQLRTRKVPRKGKWVRLTEAMRVSGLSKTQLTRLRLRQIVTIRPDPVKTRGGEPAATYAVRELKIAKKVLETRGFPKNVRSR